MSPELHDEEDKKICLVCQRQFPPEVTTCPDDGIALNCKVKDPLIGTTFDSKYEILDVVGGGGMGTVYRAKHLLMKRTVAIKVLHTAHLDSANAVKRFQAEAQAASSLSMPNISIVFDFGCTTTGQPYMVMDFLNGRPLDEIVEEEGPVSERRFLKVFMQMSRALAHAHERGIIHRDIKPSNIMLLNFEGEEDFVKLVDFGIAKILNPVDGEAANLTRTGEVFGSAHYMSPEQCRGFQLDGRTDIYSLGVAMYFALSGAPVFDDDEFLRIVYRHVTELPPSFASVGAAVDEDLEKIVLKCLAKDPDERYQTTLDLHAAFEQYIASKEAKDKSVESLSASKPVAPPAVQVSTVDLAQATAELPMAAVDPSLATAELPIAASGSGQATAELPHVTPDISEALAIISRAAEDSTETQSAVSSGFGETPAGASAETASQSVAQTQTEPSAQSVAETRKEPAAQLPSGSALSARPAVNKKVLVAVAIAAIAAAAAITFFACGGTPPAKSPETTQSLTPGSSPGQTGAAAETLSGQYVPPSGGQQTTPAYPVGATPRANSPEAEPRRSQRLHRGELSQPQYPPANVSPVEGPGAAPIAGNGGEMPTSEAENGVSVAGPAHTHAGARSSAGRQKQGPPPHGIGKFKNAIKKWWHSL